MAHCKVNIQTVNVFHTGTHDHLPQKESTHPDACYKRMTLMKTQILHKPHKSKGILTLDTATVLVYLGD